MFAQAKRLQEMCEKKNERITFASADALWLQKRHAEAEKAYKAALEEFPKSDRADRYKIGRAHV